MVPSLPPISPEPRMPTRMASSSTGQLLQVFGVASPLHLYRRGGGIDLTEIVRCELDRSGSDILLQARQLPGSWNGNDPRSLGEKPSECDLSRRRLLASCDPPKQIHKRLIRFPSLRCEARQAVSEVGTVERRVLVDRARQEASAERAIGNETDSEFLEGRQQLRLGASRP